MPDSTITVHRIERGRLQVCVYRNVAKGRVFYDTVIYRWSGKRKMWIRGPNLAPDDLPSVCEILVDVHEVIKTKNFNQINPRKFADL